MSTIPSQRELFDLPEGIAYLNCAYMGPAPRSVVAAGYRSLALKAHPWERGTEIFFDPPARLRAQFGQLIGADAEATVIAPATSYVFATAATNLPIGRGQEIVIVAEQFPSNYYCWAERAEREGARVVVVDRPGAGGPSVGATWSEAIVDAIGEATAVVTVPTVHWADGTRLDLVAIAQRAREVGAALVVDATQSLGMQPLQIDEVRPDFLACAAYKWLLGPYGLCYGYIDPKWHDGRPLEHNWINRSGSEDFSRLVDYSDEFQPGARRFEVGQAPAFVHVAMANAALELMLDWGAPAIETTLERWADRIVQEAEALGLVAPASRERSAHLLGLRFPDGAPGVLLERLAEEKIYVSLRGDSLRVAPHLYNSDRDIDRLIELLQQVIR